MAEISGRRLEFLIKSEGKNSLSHYFANGGVREHKFFVVLYILFEIYHSRYADYKLTRVTADYVRADKRVRLGVDNQFAYTV